MIGLDTNAVLRWLTRDPTAPDQSDRIVAELAARRDDVYLNPVVLAEMIWVLGRRNGLDRAGRAAVLRALMNNHRVVIGQRDIVAAATDAFESGGSGFSDHLIGELNAAAGCATTLTFDRSAGKGPHFTAIP